MKKTFLLFIALIVPLTTFSVEASANAIKVLLEGKTIPFADAQPYLNNHEVMIPVRAAADALGMKTVYRAAEKEILLLVPAASITFKIGGNSAFVNGEGPVSFGEDALLKQDRVYVPLAFFQKVLGLYTSYNADLNEAVIASAAPPVKKELPSQLVEEEVVIGEGTAYPLKGTLTMPREADGPLPAAVLVHGSGPNDRDETIGANKPFRDIAWGLAEQGIAVLRYEKRTLAYASSFTPEMLAKFTVKEETIDDAIAASRLLEKDKRINASQVYVIGHSLGGMMAPRIDAEGGDFAGLVIMAGTTRSLWELVYDQNKAYIETMDDKDPAKAANADLIAAELRKAASIKTMPEQEALGQSVFGMPAYYLRDMDLHDTGELVAASHKPIMVLQGGDDFQVFADKDYVLWQEALKVKPNAALKLYPGLNHIFMDYTGSGEGTAAEYKMPGSVDPHVIADIASWIGNNN
ncbi:alpha/beta hydrolase family protein [Cohnella rhizosphaerae]|uniref:Alpha/beta fold hydrolase n=1 Tax=Cohnella rhizosphaerae TaxID=1457232 RepID=A0A9X4QV47_9BACL|nr:alpha/beta fold hydrolase [Cohnella rhizosphaerae]MDG0811167.1 alpha/beta fold hydrolase [Cohnella rhizosphaerae]